MTLHLHNIELHQFILYLAALRKCPQKSKHNVVSEKSARKNKVANSGKKKVLLAGSRNQEPGSRCRLPPPPPRSYTWRLVTQRGGEGFSFDIFIFFVL